MSRPVNAEALRALLADVERMRAQLVALLEPAANDNELDPARDAEIVEAAKAAARAARGKRGGR